MSTLSSKRRNKLPKSDFGIPATRSFPMPDKAHAANAKARAAQAYKTGRITKAQYDHIIAMADRILSAK